MFLLSQPFGTTTSEALEPRGEKKKRKKKRGGGGGYQQNLKSDVLNICCLEKIKAGGCSNGYLNTMQCASQGRDQTMPVRIPGLCLAFLCSTVVQPGIITIAKEDL